MKPSSAATASSFELPSDLATAWPWMAIAGFQAASTAGTRYFGKYEITRRGSAWASVNLATASR
jgi:hypothetical protein